MERKQNEGTEKIMIKVAQTIIIIFIPLKATVFFSGMYHVNNLVSCTLSIIDTYIHLLSRTSILM